MASQLEAPHGGAELSIQVQPAPAVRSVLRWRRKSVAAKEERRLNGFVRFVASGEWVGNAFGTLAFLWATVVLLGAFCDQLNYSDDFGYAAAMVFIEAFRIFSRNYRLDDQSLFSTTRAISAVSSPFVRMLMRPQEWNEVVAIIGLSTYLITLVIPRLPSLVSMAALIIFIKLQFPGALWMMNRPQQHRHRHRCLLLWAILAALLLVAGLHIQVLVKHRVAQPQEREGKVLLDYVPDVVLWCAVQLTAVTAQVVAVLLLNLRPHRIASLINSPCGRKLLTSAKAFLVIYLFGGLVLSWASMSILSVSVRIRVYYVFKCLRVVGLSVATTVLSLGSLQSPSNSSSTCWIDITLHICFFGQLASSLAFIGSDLAMLAVLLIGNLQIPAAIARIVLSSLRLGSLTHQYSNKKLVTSLVIFYVLALCQGTLYIVACISDLFSFFLRRSLARLSGLRGKRGSRAVDLYYHSAYLKCMETGILSAGREISLASFAIESLSSSSRKTQLAGLLVLDALLQQREELILRIASSARTVSTLIGMLGWTDARDGETRLLAARVTAKLAGSLRVIATPGMLNLVSSLLDANNQPVIRFRSDAGDDKKSSGSDRIKSRRHDSYVSRGWRQMKKRWTVPAEPPLTPQDLFPVLGMLILERLVSDHDNSAEIGRATELISKITRFVSYNNENDAWQKEVVCSSLGFLRRLANIGGKVGVTLRQELWEDPFLLDNLAGVLEDPRTSIKVWEPAMDIVAKLALAEDARQQIGSNKVIMGKLMHTFLGRYGPTNMHYSHPLRLAAGEALANLSIDSTANCSVIMEEPGYKLIKDLKGMLWHDKYMFVAAALLQNLLAHSRDKMRSLGASEHLSHALPVVMEIIMAVEGKQLETLTGLASQICNIIPEYVVHSLESHLGVSAFVHKIVSALNANKKPSPEYPRMRRVLLELTIAIIESHPPYATIFVEEGMMEALSKIESNSSSKVERYRIFLGNAGVVLESGLPLPIMVTRAKRLIDSTTPTPGAHHWSSQLVPS